MTEEEAKIIHQQIDTWERYIIAIINSHVQALRSLIGDLTQKE